MSDWRTSEPLAVPVRTLMESLPELAVMTSVNPSKLKSSVVTLCGVAPTEMVSGAANRPSPKAR